MPTSSETATPDAEAERLYGLDPDEFVAARDAAAKALRGDGRRAEAAAVAKLRKPSVAAWVVNRLARDEAGLVEALLAAGAKLREVQLAGAAAPDLRTAIEAEGKALDALMRPAGRIAGRSASGRDAALERARETLHAAALDPELAEEVRRGTVVREQQAIGFPLGTALPDRPAREEPAKPSRRKGAAKTAEPAPVRDEVAAKRLERAARAAAAAAEKLDRAEAGLERASADLAAAREQVDGARRAHAAAERRAAGAERAAAAAARARDAAREKADQAAARHRELGGG